MNYKMLVMDMDGTLLTNEKKITDVSRRALKEASETGVKIVISTGRLFASARVYGEMIEIDTPIIASNGAYIREKDKDEVIYAALLGEENIRNILKFSHKYDMNCHFFSWDTIYSEQLEYSSLNYTKWNAALPEDRQVNIRIIDRGQWETVISEDKDKILKCIFSNNDSEKLAALRKEISSLDVEIVSSYSNNFEIMNKGESKGNAVQVLANYFNVSRDEIICIGDGENDLSMIEFAGLGIAMANGDDIVKEAADFVTLSNEDDGVAYVIDKFILNKIK